jgi:poly-gamma-glutamate capsule biosynthesis protein CapA/YwtB (metallophosphatase superfamily)
MTEITLFLSGDVMTGRGIDQVLPHSCAPALHERFASSAMDYVDLAERAHGRIVRPLSYRDIWGEALAVLQQVRPAARIINLETSVTTSEEPAPKGINYRMHPDNAAVLTAAGIDCCVLANNHVLDWGEGGLLETLETLASGGIAVAGAGRNLALAQAPAALQIGEAARVLIFAFGAADSGIPEGWAAAGAKPGVHFLRDLSAQRAAQIGALVEAAKRPGDIAVASIHWGGNWGYGVANAHRNFAHALVEHAHIDVVHGHSSHHPKGIEVYRGRLILYGCGDLMDDYEGIRGYDEFRSDLVLMYFPRLDGYTGQLIRLDLTPLRINRFRLHRPAPGERAWLRDTLDRECRRFGHRITDCVESFSLEWNE